jgi:alpha-glucosidase (family GH31 glycosyl hydrolase)
MSLVCVQINHAGVIPLVQYYGHGENVLSIPAHPPRQPGYSSVLGTVGMALAEVPVGAAVADYNQLKLWYKAGPLPDHWTTATVGDEVGANASGYSLVAMLGWVPVKPTGKFTEEIVLYVQGPSQHDHYASTNGCQGCTNSKKLHSDGFAGPDSAAACVRRTEYVDMYFFGHGVGRANYRTALADFAKLAGPIPLPRRHQLGMSWSRWSAGPVPGEPWPGLQSDMIAAIDGLAATEFPLDTFIFDMNWHLKTTGWTGYSWDETMYPNHTGLLDWIHGQGIFTAANLHDAAGVSPLEKQFDAMRTAMGLPPKAERIPFHVSSHNYTRALHDQVLAPLALEGLDFWWTDWQQQLGQSGVDVGSTDMGTPVNPTMLFNHYRFFNPQPLSPVAAEGKLRPGAALRGATHSRFGGLGGHRYTTQFGGDVVQSA